MVTERKHTPVRRSSGILPCECARLLRGSLNAHPCAYNELARILRATLRAFLRILAAAEGPHFGGFLPQKLEQRSPWMDGFADKGRRSWCRASQAGRETPAGAWRWIAALAKQYVDVLSEQPRTGEKHRELHCADAQCNTTLGA